MAELVRQLCVWRYQFKYDEFDPWDLPCRRRESSPNKLFSEGHTLTHFPSRTCTNIIEKKKTEHKTWVDISLNMVCKWAKHVNSPLLPPSKTNEIWMRKGGIPIRMAVIKQTQQYVLMRMERNWKEPLCTGLQNNEATMENSMKFHFKMKQNLQPFAPAVLLLEERFAHPNL